MSVTVTTWSELISACSGSDAIVWGGASRIENVTLEVAQNYNTLGVIDASNVPSIDFNGLTIGTISTACTGGRDFKDNGTDTEKLRAWTLGFGAVSFSGSIKNLTVEHINLENCRDILIKGFANLKNVYCYDIYASTAPNTSIWLRNSGKEQQGYHFRHCSNYIVGTGTKQMMPTSTDERYYAVTATACIFKLRTANAGITFASGAYRACELDLDYTFDWDSSKKTSEFDYLCVFPAGEITTTACTLTGTLRLKSTSEVLMAERLTSQQVLYAGKTIVNLKTAADNDFGGLIIENIPNPYPGTPNHWISPGGAGETQTSIVTNNGNYNLTGVYERYAVLLGDMRNIDILQARGYEVEPDDGFRQTQYNSDDWDVYTDAWDRRIYSATNDGLPFLPMWYYPYNDTPQPQGDPEYNYICVFDMETQQNAFDGNGLAILEPTQCRVTEELNGGWYLTLTHPKDRDGKWHFILEMNIIKCLGQLFIIRKVTTKNTANSQTVTAYAEHITYHLNDYWLFPGTSIAGYQGQTLINSILAQMWDVGEEGQTRYTFDITTDLNSDPTFKEWYEMPEGHTPYEMILGSNGFTSLIGGELYRDNFTVKINERMYGAEENAFILHPNLNLKSVEKTVDVQTFCTYFRAYDDRGGWWAVAWDPTTLPRAYPHNVVRSQNFTFDVEDEYYDFEMLVRKGQDFFGKHCAPLISFKLAVQDLKRHPDYKDFLNNYRFKVGDVGKVWDEDSERYYELEITKTVKDGITGDCVEVVIGTERSFTRPSGYPITLDRNFSWNVVDEYDPDNPPEPPEPPYDPSTVDLDYVYEVNNNDEITLLLYLGNAERVEVPSVGEDNKPVVRIAASCFDGAFNLEAVKIPEGIEVIE